MATQILIIFFFIRTNGRPWQDFPRPALAASSLLVAVALPFTPMGGWFGFTVPPIGILLGVSAIVLIYLALAELLEPLAIKARAR